MERKELLHSREYWLIQIQNNLYNLIENYRKSKSLNRTELALELGFTKGYVSQILKGDFDHKISKMVDLALAFGKAPIFEYKDLENFIINDEKINVPHYEYSFTATIPIRSENKAIAKDIKTSSDFLYAVPEKRPYDVDVKNQSKETA